MHLVYQILLDENIISMVDMGKQWQKEGPDRRANLIYSSMYKETCLMDLHKNN